MLKSLAATAAALLISAQALSTAQADPPNHNQDLSQSPQQEARGSSTPQAIVTRTGTLLVTGKITAMTSFALPVLCYIEISHNGIREYATRAATFKGKVGTCAVPFRYKWAFADDTDNFDVYVEVEGSYASSPAISSYRESDFQFPSMPLPADGATTKLNFDIVL